MARRVRDAVLSCVGAVVGAGFASGREIIRFFSRYGPFSWIGIVLASASVGFFAWMLMRRAREAGADSLSRLSNAYLGRAGIAGTIAFTLLLSITGGSMTAAAGELGALTLPVHGAYWIAFFATLILSLLLTHRSLSPLAFISFLLIPVLTLAFLMCLVLPKGEAATQEALLPAWRKILEAVLLGLSYSAMNITLAAGVLCELGQGLNRKNAAWTAVFLGLALLALLSLGNTVLLRQPELVSAALPMVMLLNKFGKLGFWLAAAGLYLAVFTTLMAAARSFFNIVDACGHAFIGLAVTGGLFLLVGVVGFSRLVEAAYPILGFVCLFLLLWIMVGKRGDAGANLTAKQDHSKPSC